MVNMYHIVMVAVGLALIAAWWPTSVQSQIYVPDGTGAIVAQPFTVDTVMWAALLWDAGCDLFWTDADGLALPGNWPVHGAYEVYDAVGIQNF